MNNLDTSGDTSGDVSQDLSIELKKHIYILEKYCAIYTFSVHSKQAAAELIRLKREGIISPENDPSSMNFERVAMVLFVCGDSLISKLTNDRITLIIDTLFDGNVSNHLAQIIYNFMISPPASFQHH